MGLNKIMMVFGIAIFLSINLVSAVFIQSVVAPELLPGEEGRIRIEVENIFNDDVEELTFRLDFTGIPLTPIGSSEDNVDELNDNDDVTFEFKLKTANDIKPGDYEIPYIITYERKGDLKTRTGSIGVKVRADTELSFSVNENNNVVGEQGEILLRIVNSGFGDIKFVNVKIIPDGFSLLSDDEIYIGTVDSDDFETATFDVRFDQENAILKAVIGYKDFDNVRVVENVNMPLNIYSREKGLELGIIKKSNSGTIIGIVLFFILLWILIRMWRKSRRARNSKKGK